MAVKRQKQLWREVQGGLTARAWPFAWLIVAVLPFGLPRYCVDQFSLQAVEGRLVFSILVPRRRIYYLKLLRLFL